MPLSTTQQKYLAIAWACFETEPKIDYEKFRELAGLASAHSARELMRVTKKKLREEYGPASGDAAGTATATPAKKGAAKKATPAKNSTGKGRKRKADVLDGEEGEQSSGSGTVTPMPARMKTQTKSKVKKEEPPVDVDSGVEEDFEDLIQRQMAGQDGYF